MNKKLLIFAITFPNLAGCAAFTPNEIANPSTLTIDNALAQVGKGFHDMRAELHKNENGHPRPLGLYACKVIVSLNVTASAGQDGKLTLDLSTKTPATATTNFSGAAHAEQTNTSNATRGNNINIEMYNPACLPKDTLGYDKPGGVKTVFDAEHAMYPDGPAASLAASTFRKKYKQ